MDYFVLKNVDINSLRKTKGIRFKTIVRKKTNNKVKSFVNQNGQKVRVTYTHNVRFEDIAEGQVQCWWDRHIIDGAVMCMPYKITKINDVYFVSGKGHYCSLRCMLAKALDEEKKQSCFRDKRYGHAIGNIYQLYNILFPNAEEELIPADDWEILSISGSGDQSIQEFRNENINKIYLKVPNVAFQPISSTFVAEN